MSKLVALALCLSLTGAPAAEEAPRTEGEVVIVEPDLGAVRQGVLRLRAGARTDGTWALVNSLISASIAIGLAAVIGATNLFFPDNLSGSDQVTRALIVGSLAVAGASQIATGLYDVLGEPATVVSADYLLSDPAAMEASGLFFLEDRAAMGKDRRIRGAITEMTSALGAALGGGLLLASDVDIPNSGILLGITFGLSGIQLITGMLKIFQQSTEEKIYEAVLETGRRVPAYREEEEGIEPGGPALRGGLRPEHPGYGLSVGGSF